jgi:hypothetical protein
MLKFQFTPVTLYRRSASWRHRGTSLEMLDISLWPFVGWFRRHTRTGSHSGGSMSSFMALHFSTPSATLQPTLKFQFIPRPLSHRRSASARQAAKLVIANSSRVPFVGWFKRQILLEIAPWKGPGSPVRAVFVRLPARCHHSISARR